VKPAEDVYWGSPKTHKEKWNTTHYEKIILNVFDNRSLMKEEEHTLISNSMGIDEKCLNCNNGGIVYFDEEVRRKISEANRRRGPRSEESKRRMSEKMKGEGNHFYGKSHTEEALERIRLHSVGENNPRFGVVMDYELKEKISIARGGREVSLVSPKGEVFTFINQSEFARNHNLSAKGVSAVLLRRQKSHRGWRLP
jgi:hypothetical protein